MKRIIAWGLTLSLCCVMIVTAVFAEEGKPGETQEPVTAEQAAEPSETTETAQQAPAEEAAGQDGNTQTTPETAEEEAAAEAAGA